MPGLHYTVGKGNSDNMINVQIQVLILKGYLSLRLNLRMFGCICYLKKIYLLCFFQVNKSVYICNKTKCSEERQALIASYIYIYLYLSIYLSNCTISLAPHRCCKTNSAQRIPGALTFSAHENILIAPDKSLSAPVKVGEQLGTKDINLGR